ncbi:wax ester synthase/diacylglycerol acyltransferase 5-like [Triticum aestivum]|nr:wax ester synthase/diacylglycerol acyltransferase 5-like [Triticum aestivum]
MEPVSGSPWVSVPRNRLLPIRMSTEHAGTEWTPENPAEEPVSPTARAMEDIGIYIVVTIGLDTPINLSIFRAGIESLLARCPRLGCIQVADGSSNGGARWARTAVNAEDHMIVPRLDGAAVAAYPDKAVEDYVASLPTLPMDRSRALLEFHLLDFPTSEATSTVAVRVHHAYGDGMSLMALLMMSTRSGAADTKCQPATPTPTPPPRRPTRAGAIYASQRRPPLSAGALPLVAWVWSYLVVAWNTAADLAYFAATILFLSDPRTLFKRADDDEFHAKRFVHRSLSLDDVKFLKSSMNCTVNDVLVAVTSAALSRYYFRKSGDTNTSKICLRSLLPVNTRPATSLQTYVNVIESDKRNEVTWGNKLGYIILPFYLAMHEDPLAYIRKAKKVLDRKKRSLEVILTYKIGLIFTKKFGVKVGTSIFRCLFARTTIVFSNMVGPAEQVELCGHPVAFLAPSVYGIPEALIIHYQSYRSTIKIILSVDEDKFSDCHQLLDDFDQTLTVMKDAASILSTSTKND